MGNDSVDGMQWDFLLHFFLFEETSYMGSKLPMEGYKMDLDISSDTERVSVYLHFRVQSRK